MRYSCLTGSLGRNPFRRFPYTPGPLGSNDFGDPNMTDWMLGDSPGPLGVRDCGDPFLFMGTNLLSAEIRNEFKLLKGKITDTKEKDYLDHIISFFGSVPQYEAFSTESDKELDDTKGLRKMIELHGETQTVFYRWVRKAYKNKGVEDVPALIKRQQSEELSKALKEVRVSYGKGFKAGGFNPRPMKDSNYRYRLGTVSEHGMGMAMDIEDSTNPILSIGDWKFIEMLTETDPFPRTLKRWKEHPDDLWQDIKNLSDSFVITVATKVKEIEDERAAFKKKLDEEAQKEKPDAWYVEYVKQEAKKKSPPPELPLSIILKGHAALMQWTKGFFTLDLKLVGLLHEHGFIWGATFSNAVDLQHFELPEKSCERQRLDVRC